MNGVKHVHSMSIVHRDLKPQNILIQKKIDNTKQQQQIDNNNNNNVFETYTPKISDMGLSKKVYIYFYLFILFLFIISFSWMLIILLIHNQHI